MNIEISVTHTLSPDVMDLIAKALNGNAETSPKRARKVETKLVEVAEPVKEEAPAKVVKRITLEEVSARALTLANGGKRSEVKDLLKDFAVAKVSLLKEEQFSDFLNALNQI